MQLTFVSETAHDQESFAAFLASRPADDIHKYELLDGRIVMNPPSGWPHGEAEVDLCAVLRNHVRPRKMGMVGGPTQGYELPNGHTVAPDASVVLEERLAKGPPRVKGKFLRVIPNLVAEVLSPDSEKRDRKQKLRIYAEAGIEEYWLVDLDRRALTVFRLTSRGVYDEGRQFSAKQKVRSQVLPDLDCPVEEMLPAE